MKTLNSITNGFSLIKGADSVQPVYVEVDGGFQELSHQNAQMVMLLGGEGPRALVGQDAADAVAADAILRLARVQQLRAAWAALRPGDIEAVMKHTGHGQFPFEGLVSGMNFLSAVSRGADWEPNTFYATEPGCEVAEAVTAEEEEDDPFVFTEPAPALPIDERRKKMGKLIQGLATRVGTTPELIERYELLKLSFDHGASMEFLVETSASLVKSHFEIIANEALGD